MLPERSPLNRAPLRLLIVDDSPVARRLLQEAFESQDYDVTTANDGAEGLEKVRQHCPDVIVTDSVMPNIDGYAFLRRLRENPETRLIPVVMLTASECSEGQGTEDVQPDAYASKSSDWPTLLSLVGALIASRETDPV